MTGKNSQTSISIIIPTYNNAAYLQKCLESVAKTAYPFYECIVVDDNSSKSPAEITGQFNVSLIELKTNRGPANARNTGARKASGDILFFVDSDISIYPDTVQKIVDVLDNNPQADALFGSYDAQPFDTSFISQYKNLFHHYIHQRSKEEALTFWAGCGAVRRHVFIMTGGFDTKYNTPAIEDIDFGYKLHTRGHKILLQKHIQVKHLKHWSFLGLLKAEVFYRGIPWTRLLLRKKILPNDLNTSRDQTASVFLIYLILFLLLLNIIFPLPPAVWSVYPVLLATVLLLNRDFYRFFFKKRGFLFALRVFPMHMLYFFYSGLSFIAGIIYHLFMDGGRTRM